MEGDGGGLLEEQAELGGLGGAHLRGGPELAGVELALQGHQLGGGAGHEGGEGDGVEG